MARILYAALMMCGFCCFIGSAFTDSDGYISEISNFEQQFAAYDTDKVRASV